MKLRSLYSIKHSVSNEACYLPNPFYGSAERASRFLQQKFAVDLLRLGQAVKNSGLIETSSWMHGDKGELCKW